MDKVFSARLDESAIEEMTRVAKRLGMTKKEFLESAIRLRARDLDAKSGTDVWEETCGAWARDEDPAGTFARSRQEFEAAFRRHHKRRSSAKRAKRTRSE
jgi:antitoxin component of RelBE/YafQ-DinJ toxin-antitoxin module